MWTQAEAIELCRAVEPIVARFQCHVALTGGLLYKDGPRKDCDLIVYRAGLEFGDEPRGSFSETVDRDAMFAALVEIGITVTVEHTRVVKAIFGLANSRYQAVDFIFPECEVEYVPGAEAKESVAIDLLTQATP